MSITHIQNPHLFSSHTHSAAAHPLSYRVDLPSNTLKELDVYQYCTVEVGSEWAVCGGM